MLGGMREQVNESQGGSRISRDRWRNIAISLIDHRTYSYASRMNISWQNNKVGNQTQSGFNENLLKKSNAA